MTIIRILKTKGYYFSLSKDLTKYYYKKKEEEEESYIQNILRIVHTRKTQCSICSEQFKDFNLMLLYSFWILRKNMQFFNIIFHDRNMRAKH